MAKKYDRIQNVKASCKKFGFKTLDDLCQEITVQDVDDELIELNNIGGLKGWYAVCDTDGINSYHSTEKEALRERLDLINRILND